MRAHYHDFKEVILPYSATLYQLQVNLRESIYG